MKNPKIYKIISALFALVLMAGDLTAMLPASTNTDLFIIICLVGTVAGSAFETYFNPALPNKFLVVQIIGAIGFTAGGLVDHADKFMLTEDMTQVIRFSLVFTWKAADYILKELKQL